MARAGARLGVVVVSYGEVTLLCGLVAVACCGNEAVRGGIQSNRF